MKLLLSLGAVLALAYAGLGALLFFFQRSFIYYPQLVPPGGNAVLDVGDARLRLTVRDHDGPQALLYFGGNAEAVAASLPELAETFPGHALYLLHYRGYGGSEGRPTEAALLADGVALFDHVAARHARVTAIGRSLGSAVALHVASRRPVERLVLVTPFDSLAAVAARHYPFYPVRWLLRDRYESFRSAPQVTAPTRLIVAADDEIVPRASAEALLERFPPGVARLLVLPGGHNSIGGPDYLAALRN